MHIHGRLKCTFMEGSLLAFCSSWMSDCFQQCGSASKRACVHIYLNLVVQNVVLIFVLV